MYTDLAVILNEIPKPICAVREDDGNIVCGNNAFIQMSGLENFIGKSGKDYMNGRDLHAVKYHGENVFIIFFDDTSKEIALREATKAAKEASELKSKFLANMSHEIRTPMNAIKGLAELLALTELNSIQDSYVRNIVKSSNTLLSIINDVLDFTKINENKVEFVEGQYLLEDMIAEVTNVVSLRAAEKGLTMFMDISPSLPKGLIGDDVRVKQVIINILNNAVKYTPEGHITVRLWGEEANGVFELVCIVEDTGIGIKEEDIPYLFEAFTQADRYMNHHIQGTGLGLSICDQLLRSMGGTISVESVYGEGSTFTVRIPQKIFNTEPIASLENPKGINVLLLDKSEQIKCLARMLNQLGVSYTAVSSYNDLKYSDDNYTHCICDDNFSEISVRRIRGRMPDCVFIAVKDMRYAMEQSELHDTVMFIPLLITELVKSLTKVTRKDGTELNSSKTIDEFALKDTHVLIVDDNEINLIVSGEILRAYKAEVTCAESGKESLKLCETNKYDLIFMDHMMPEMDGVEATLRLRHGNSINKSTPVIALTANVVNDMAKFYIENGMDDFIGKPIDLEELSRILLRWLPSDKITEMEEALKREETEPEPANVNTMERLIQSLDTFGMYVSDVMREINSDYDVFVRRMDRICKNLGPLVKKLREEVRDEDWDKFGDDIGEMYTMIHDVGARDCSGRARKLGNAARERNIDYIKGDFFSLMDNMYMLEKKMEVALPLALGNISPDVPFGDMNYCYERLVEMTDALADHEYEICVGLLDSLAHYSLDHALDLILCALGAKLNEYDYDEAISLHKQAVEHCEAIISL